MKIVDATPEEARLLNPGVAIYRNASAETRAMLTLRPGKAVRIVGHSHQPVRPDRPMLCRVAAALRINAHRRGLKVLVRHDGADLLVGRLR